MEDVFDMFSAAELYKCHRAYLARRDDVPEPLPQKHKAIRTMKATNARRRAWLKKAGNKLRLGKAVDLYYECMMWGCGPMASFGCMPEDDHVFRVADELAGAESVERVAEQLSSGARMAATHVLTEQMWAKVAICSPIHDALSEVPCLPRLPIA